MSNKVLAEILDAAMRDMRAHIERAYAAGGDGVRQELLSMLSPSVNVSAAPQQPDKRATSDRAAPGTVKPTILELIAKSSLFGGVTAAELIKETGFKENSVRGTLSTLRSDGAIQQIGDRWVMCSSFEKNEAPALRAGANESV